MAKVIISVEYKIRISDEESKPGDIVLSALPDPLTGEVDREHATETMQKAALLLFSYLLHEAKAHVLECGTGACKGHDGGEVFMESGALDPEWN